MIKRLMAMGLVGMGMGWGAAVLGPPVQQCADGAGVIGVANNLFIPFVLWTNTGFACEQQDKIYSNFSQTGIPILTILEVQQQPVSGADLHTATFTGNFLTDFTVSYDIAIDLTQNPNEKIVRVSGDIANPSALGSPVVVKSVFSEAGAIIGNVVSTPNNPGLPLTTSNTALHVQDVYIAGGGAAVSIANSFEEQTPTPELASLLLIGSGLMGLGLIKRKMLVG